MKKMDESVRFVKNVWALTKSYWQSEEKKKAYLLLLAIIALTLGVVFMLVQLSSTSGIIFFTARCRITKRKKSFRNCSTSAGWLLSISSWPCTPFICSRC